MAKTNEPHTWMGKPVASLQHINDLDRAAAVNEFHHKQPRDVAEDHAYRNYLKEQHTKAAAHHLARGKGARAAGDAEAARKHGRLYEMHVKALGHTPYGPVPPEVMATHTKQQQEGHVVEFQAHTGDQFLLDGDKKLAEPSKSDK